jgi:SAM-dependent methyltransferase
MFSHQINHCPACSSSNIDRAYLTSQQGFMSLPDCRHDRCIDCGTVFMNPRPTDAELTAFYQASSTEDTVQDIARSSAERVLDADRLEYFRANRITPLMQYLTPASQVYDVGCGVGTFVYTMNREGISTRGNDISRISVETGREVLGLSPAVIEVGDIMSIPTGRNFDLVTLWTVIEHLLDPVKYLEHLRGHCLSRDGLIVLEFPTVDSLMFEYCREHFFWVMPPYHINLFSMQGMRSLLERAGFEALYEHCMPNNWYF